jgi:hypothetical protein
VVIKVRSKKRFRRKYKRRYFIVFYAYLDSRGCGGHGSAPADSHGYLNHESFCEQMKIRFGFRKMFINGIVEVTHGEYVEYTRKDSDCEVS